MDASQMVETMKSSFLFSFHTGNVLVDTLVTGLIVMLTTYILSLVSKLQDIDPKALYERWFGEEPPPENKIIISGKTIRADDSTRQDFSTTFLALVQQIKKLDCEKSEIRELSEIKIEDFQNNYYDSDDEEEDEKKQDTTVDLMVSQSEEFKLAENIDAVVRTSSADADSEKKTVSTEEFQITIKSSVLSMDALRNVINGWIKEYEDSMKPDEYLRYFCYIPSEDAESSYYDATTNYSEFRFESNKSFDNVFFPEREDIMKRLDFFANNKDWYKTRGIPYTMGFLFYGVPGCGKTSTIKAIANYTQRHIVSVPLNGIKTAKELLSIFYSTQINKKHIPLSKRLYILEDIDCDSLKDIVGDRATKTDKSESDDDDEEEGTSLALLNSMKAPNMKKIFDMRSNRLTLAGLLEVLDGVMEMDGRMLIITTNYPERLDKALIRPGRIDIKLKFSKCTAETLVYMYEHFFQATLPERFKTTLPDKRWTPAEATQVFLNHMNNPPEGLTYLINSKPKDSTDIKALVLSRQSSTLEKQDTVDNDGVQPKDKVLNKLNKVAAILENDEEDS